MSKDPLHVFEVVDTEVLKVFNSMWNLAFSEGALSAKTKVLIAMALDASAGATEGVVALTRRAISLGVTSQEAMEASMWLTTADAQGQCILQQSRFKRL